jgi:hypothetical protein
MDAVIMNMDIKVEDFITISNDMSPQISDQDFIMTGDWNGPNTGIWIAKVSPFTSWFFQLAWDVGSDFATQEISREGIAYPFEYEQRVFHYLLNTQIWQDRRLPPYRAGPISAVAAEPVGQSKQPVAVGKVDRLYTSEQIRTHFAFLPQCSFNSYSIHPFFLKGNQNKEKSQYIQGDFLIHFAGKKGSVKTNIIKHYLALAESMQLNRVSSTSEQPPAAAGLKAEAAPG